MSEADLPPSGPPPVRRARRWTIAIEAIALIAVLVLAVLVRLPDDPGGQRYDELWHLGLSAGRGNPFGYFERNVVHLDPVAQTSTVGAPAAWHVWTGMDGVLHPPLYCQTLRFWRDAFGDAELTARAYSIFWSLVAIGFQFATVRLGIGRVTAAFAALAMALAPTQVELGREIRSYQMLVAIGCAALWIMTRIELLGATRRRAVALGAMPFALVLTHYFAFGAAVGIAIVGLWRLGAQRRAFAITVAATAALYAVVWLPFALRQIDDLHTGDAWLTAEAETRWERPVLIATAPFRLIVDRARAVEPMGVLGGLLFVLPWPLIRRLPALRPWAIWLAAGVVPIALLDFVRGTEAVTLTRYLDVAAPAVVPLFAGVVAAYRPAWGAATAAAVAVLGGVYLASGQRMYDPGPGFAAATRAAAKRVGPGDALLAYSGSFPREVSTAILLHASHEPGLFPRPIVDVDEPLPRSVTRQLPRRAWLLAGPLKHSIEDLVPGSRVVGARGVDRGITLYQLEMAGDGPAPATAPATVP